MFKRILMWGVWLCVHYLQFVSGFRWVFVQQAKDSKRALNREALWIKSFVHNSLPAEVDYALILRRGKDVVATSNLPESDLDALLEYVLDDDDEDAAPPAPSAPEAPAETPSGPAAA